MLETHYECPCLDKCPLNYAMSIIGGKWKMQIICALNNRGTLRYNELRRKMDGISNTVLASSLRELEEEGLVIRKEYMEVPIRRGVFHDDALRRLCRSSKVSATGVRR